MSAGAPIWKVCAVWIIRVLSAAVFIASGWAKAIDPRGFAFKIDEYLAVWHIAGILPDGITGIIGAAISIIELVIGFLLLTGSLRRAAPILALCMMAVWLPLTAYIAIVDPVPDCGCFGDMITLSNTATFVKNAFLVVLLVLCFKWRKAALPLYRPGLQWLIILLTVVYGISITFIGWNFQPLVDFRPYPVGTTLNDGSVEMPYTYIYSKDGVERRFTLDDLPDSTWIFERAVVLPTSRPRGIAVFDGYEEVTDEIFGENPPHEMIVLVYSQPGLDDLLRSRMANEIYEYATRRDIAMVGLVAASDAALEQWKQLARPAYEVYSASSVDLKQLVRGPIGMVFLRDGKVIWKRNFSTIPADLLSNDDPFGSVYVFDDGRVALWLSGFFIFGLILLLAISRLTTITIKPPGSLSKNKHLKASE